MSNKLKPTDKSAGYDVRPGDFLTMGATKVECGVNFTVMSIHAIGCEVVLYKRGAAAFDRGGALFIMSFLIGQERISAP